jgi:Mg-chelatase subunit ChlD
MQLTKQNQSLVEGSLYEIAKNTNQSIAESFINCDVVILVDTSGSMSASDSRDGQSRYDVACAELRALQGSLPGKIAVLSFSEHVHFCPTGLPIYQGSTTDMAKALQFAKVADGIPGMRFILISDGEPDYPTDTLRIAASYKNKIDTIYVGPENRPIGRDFLEKLAQTSGGQTITADRAKELKSGIETLLLNAG